ncbi:MAG: arginine repressor [Clostridia bacterium]|nr:arginine repressor [Clostridia bacterium]
MKLKRHTVILDLIEKYNIDTQEELARRLKESGLVVTQATVSRDIKDLKLIKVLDDNGVYKYVQSGAKESVASDKKFNSILVNSVTHVECAMNIVVIKTHAGMAQAVGFVIDTSAFDEIIGCVAGDDTLLCVTKSEKNAEVLADKIKLIIKS